MKNIGIDVGGTSIKVGIVDEQGKILNKLSFPTLVERGHGAVIADMANFSVKLIQDSGIPMDEIESVGIGIPGIYDVRRNIVPFCTNLFWHEVPLVQLMRKVLDKPTYVGNDASVAGLAETLFGASKGTKNSVFLTLGTGLGGGVVLGGKLFTGYHGVGTEVGHMIVEAGGVQCTCGNKGCWERYAAATGLIRMAREAVAKHPDSMILREAGGNPEKIDGKIAIDCAKAGDPVAVDVFRAFIYYLCVGIVSLINTFDPEVIILGGGVSHAGQMLVDAVNETLPGMVFCKEMPYAKIVLATLGNDAGIIGAAMLGGAQ